MAETNVRMKKKEVGPFEFSEQTMEEMGGCGCLLVAGDERKNNVMTIGWGFLGVLWGRPMFMVAVRPSRHTFGFLEESAEFTVNVPRKGIEDALTLCGTKSGRDMDKFKEAGLTRLAGKKVRTPIIEECIVNYECKTVWKTKMQEKDLPGFAKSGFYKSGDFHTVYFGEIVSVRADEDAIVSPSV
jgi:flavin reductase (DIM6/NTAB) family NADH-FMN oxidoreductase RutF